MEWNPGVCRALLEQSVDEGLFSECRALLILDIFLHQFFSLIIQWLANIRLPSLLVGNIRYPLLAVAAIGDIAFLPSFSCGVNGHCEHPGLCRYA
jgi:hypothetical protein